MKPEIAQLCLDHLHEYAIQFKKPEMVAPDGTIQTFNGMLCDLAPKDICDWQEKAFGSWTASGWYCGLPFRVKHWAGLPIDQSRFPEGIHTKRQLVAWLKREARGGK